MVTGASGARLGSSPPAETLRPHSLLLSHTRVKLRLSSGKELWLTQLSVEIAMSF